MKKFLHVAEHYGSIPFVARECWNGRQARLRILCPLGRVGSSPISRRNKNTEYVANYRKKLGVFLCSQDFRNRLVYFYFYKEGNSFLSKVFPKMDSNVRIEEMFLEESNENKLERRF